jgi:hypothetical protein
MDNKMELLRISPDVRSHTQIHTNIINLVFVYNVTSRFVIIKTVLFSLPFACSTPANIQLCDLLNNKNFVGHQDILFLEQYI